MEQCVQLLEKVDVASGEASKGDVEMLRSMANVFLSFPDTVPLPAHDLFTNAEVAPRYHINRFEGHVVGSHADAAPQKWEL